MRKNSRMVLRSVSVYAIICSLMMSSILDGQVRLLLSAAISPMYRVFRKYQYVRSLALCVHHGYSNPYIVESLKKQGPTFLDELSSNVYYSPVNNPNYKNNGINEALTVLDAIRFFKFEPDDIVVKITGRYFLQQDNFLKIVENNPEIDAFVKIDEFGNVFTAGFAMRCYHMEEMYASMDYEHMEKDWSLVEYEVGFFIKRKLQTNGFRVMYLDTLGLEAHLLGSTTAANNPKNIVFH